MVQTPIGTNFPQGVAPTNTVTAQAVVSGQVRAVTLPPTLTQALSTGQPVAGQVTGRPAAGQITVTTAQGVAQLQTTLPLPQNSTVTLQLLNAGPPATLQIQTTTQGQANAQTGPGAGGQGGVQGGGQPAAPAAAPASTGAGPAFVTSLTQGTVIQATVVGAPAGQAGATASSAQPTPTNQPSGAPAGQPASTPASATPQSAPLSTSSTVPVRIVEFALPNQGGLSNTASNTTLTGTVTGSGGGGQSIVQTPLGTLSLATQQALPVGTLLSFELAGAARPSADATGTAFNIERWSGLKEAMSLIQQGDPAGAQRILQSVVPQPGPQLGASMLFFLSALRGGGLDRLLGGDGTRSIDRAGGRGAVSRAEGDLGGAVGRARDSGGGEWRAYSLPVQQNGDLDTLRLYVRGEREEPDDEDAGSGLANAKRFIVEANFSRLGPFQFDGLVRDRKVDLMVRTHTGLEDGMRDDIRVLFANTTSALGLDGRVDFHVVKAFDVVLADVDDVPVRPGVTV